jgi:hypothetical protein
MPANAYTHKHTSSVLAQFVLLGVPADATTSTGPRWWSHPPCQHGSLRMTRMRTTCSSSSSHASRCAAWVCLLLLLLLLVQFAGCCYVHRAPTPARAPRVQQARTQHTHLFCARLPSLPTALSVQMPKQATSPSNIHNTVMQAQLVVSLQQPLPAAVHVLSCTCSRRPLVRPA